MTLKEQIAKLYTQTTLSFSDIHIEVGKPLCIRVPTGVIPVDSSLGKVTKEELVEFLSEFSPNGDAGAEYWQERLDQKGGQVKFGLKLGPEVYMRAALFNVGASMNESRAWALALRNLPKEIRSFEQIGLPRELTKWLKRPSGLIIFTGVTGSGKSTSMAAALDYVNTNEAYRIITLEDPIEYRHLDKQSMISQRELGVDFSTFEEGVEQAMRQDPDMLVVGEVASLESLKACMSIALSGHLVITSMHTVNAASTVNRMLDMYPADERDEIKSVIGGLLIGVVAQRLLPSQEGDSRHLAHEIMTVTPSIASVIRDGKTVQIANEINRKRPTQHLLNTVLAHLLSEKKISERTAISASYDPKDLLQNLDAEMLDEEEEDEYR